MKRVFNAIGAFLVSPFSEYGFKWQEVNGVAAMKKRPLAGFYSVGLGDELIDTADDLNGLDMLGAKHVGPKRSILPSRPSKSTTPSKDKAAKLHPFHAAPAAHRSAVNAATSGARALKSAQKKFETVINGTNGSGTVLIGAVTGKTKTLSRKLTPRQKSALDRYNKAATKSTNAGTAAAKSGAKALSVAKSTFDAIKNASAGVRAMMSKSTVMHGGDVPVPAYSPYGSYNLGDVVMCDGKYWKLARGMDSYEKEFKAPGPSSWNPVSMSPWDQMPGIPTGMYGTRIGDDYNDGYGDGLANLPNKHTSGPYTAGWQAGDSARSMAPPPSGGYSLGPDPLIRGFAGSGTRIGDAWGDGYLDGYNGRKILDPFASDTYTSGFQQGVSDAGTGRSANPVMHGIYGDLVGFPNWTEIGDDSPPPDVPPTPAPSLDTGVATMPPDGVVYDGSQKGWPNFAFGSFSQFLGPKGSDGLGAWGFLWGNYPGLSGGGPMWTLRNGGNRFGQANWAPYPADPPGDASAIAPLSAQGLGKEGGGGGWGITDGQWAAAGYTGPVYGPLIGNPNGDFKGLRWFQTSKQWGWYLEEAPSWATAELRYAAAKLQAAQAAADQAAADADAKAAAKVQADQAAQQANQDFQNALQEQKAQSDANVSQMQQASQQATIDQQQAQAQSQLDIQTQQAQLEMTQKQSDVDVQTQQAQLDWARAHPDQAFGPPQQQAQADPSQGPWQSTQEDAEHSLPLPDAGAPGFVESRDIESSFQQADDAGQQQPTFDDVPENQ